MPDAFIQSDLRMRNVATRAIKHNCVSCWLIVWKRIPSVTSGERVSLRRWREVLLHFVTPKQDCSVCCEMENRRGFDVFMKGKSICPWVFSECVRPDVYLFEYFGVVNAFVACLSSCEIRTWECSRHLSVRRMRSCDPFSVVRWDSGGVRTPAGLVWALDTWFVGDALWVNG